MESRRRFLKKILSRNFMRSTTGILILCSEVWSFAKAEGEAEVFVISSGGSGIPVYRNLQKAKIPFSAGILYTNDIDYHLAKHLAVNVIEEEPFEPVSDRAFEWAKQMIRQCKKVINAGIVIGTTNRKMKELLVFAEEMGKLESYENRLLHITVEMEKERRRRQQGLQCAQLEAVCGFCLPVF